MKCHDDQDADELQHGLPLLLPSCILLKYKEGQSVLGGYEQHLNIAISIAESAFENKGD